MTGPLVKFVPVIGPHWDCCVTLLGHGAVQKCGQLAGGGAYSEDVPSDLYLIMVSYPLPNSTTIIAPFIFPSQRY